MANYFSIYKRRIYLLNIYIIICHLKQGCNCLSADVVAPSTLTVGSTADLECKWKVGQNEEIYSVKWYQGLNEIYRYTPSKYPKDIQLFRNDNLLIDAVASKHGKVRIANVTLRANGIFRCEVSGEGPSFYTVYGAVNITIVSPPDGNPAIMGQKLIYQVGDWVDLTCQTTKSKPAPKLKFYINEQEPPQEMLEQQKFYPPLKDGLLESSLRLRFILSDNMLDFKGSMRIRCTAEILDVYLGSTNFLIITDILHPASAYGAKASIIINKEGCLPTFCTLAIVMYSTVTLRMLI